jgi:hypothetical protein
LLILQGRNCAVWALSARRKKKRQKTFQIEEKNMSLADLGDRLLGLIDEKGDDDDDGSESTNFTFTFTSFKGVGEQRSRSGRQEKKEKKEEKADDEKETEEVKQIRRFQEDMAFYERNPCGVILVSKKSADEKPRIHPVHRGRKGLQVASSDNVALLAALLLPAAAELTHQKEPEQIQTLGRIDMNMACAVRYTWRCILRLLYDSEFLSTESGDYCIPQGYATDDFVSYTQFHVWNKV